MVTLIWIGPARDRTCTAAALLGLRARSSGGTRGARAPGAAAPDGSTWPVAGDQARGGGCRLVGGQQLHVPFRGVPATHDVYVYGVHYTGKRVGNTTCEIGRAHV